MKKKEKIEKKGESKRKKNSESQRKKNSDKSKKVEVGRMNYEGNGKLQMTNVKVSRREVKKKKSVRLVSPT